MKVEARRQRKKATARVRRVPQVRIRAAESFARPPANERKTSKQGGAKRSRSVRESARDEARCAYRDAILSAAERVFATSGFYVTRVADIAKEAGVGVGTLYNYFDSKEVIFSKLIETRHEEFRRAVVGAAVAADPVERLEQIVECVLTTLGEKGALLAVFTERGAIGEYDVERLIGDSVARDYGEFLSLLEATVREAARAKRLRADVDPRLLVSCLSGSINGAIYSWLKRGRRGRLGAVAHAVFDIFVQGARYQ